MLPPWMPRWGVRGDLAADEVLGHRDEVLVGLVAVRLERRLVPLRAELAAAADVRDHVDAALLEPGRAHAAAVAGHHRHLEAAVAVEEGRVLPVEGEVLPGHLEVRDPRPVLRRGLVLADREALRVEVRRQLLELLRRALADRAEGEARRRQVVGDGQEVVVRLLVVHPARAHRAELGHPGQRLARPRPVLAGQDVDAVAHVVELVEQHVVEGRAEAGERLPLGRLEEHVEAPLALQEALEVRGEEGTRGVGLPADRPVVAQLEEQQVAVDGGVRAVRLVDLEELAVAAQEHLVRVEGDRPVDEVALEALRVVAKGGDRDVLGLALEDRLGRGERGAPLPGLRDPRVARRGHRSGTEVRADVEACPRRASPRRSWTRAGRSRPSGTSSPRGRTPATTSASAPPRESWTRQRL